MGTSQIFQNWGPDIPMTQRPVHEYDPGAVTFSPTTHAGLLRDLRAPLYIRDYRAHVLVLFHSTKCALWQQGGN